jgi:hypothetical protein
MKTRNKMLEIPMLRCTILMCCGGTVEEFCKIYAKWHGIHKDSVKNLHEADGKTVWDTDVGDWFSVWCKEPRPSTIAHEAVHVVLNILEQKGIARDEELIAYMAGYIVNQFLIAFAPVNEAHNH